MGGRVRSDNGDLGKKIINRGAIIITSRKLSLEEREPTEKKKRNLARSKKALLEPLSKI